MFSATALIIETLKQLATDGEGQMNGSPITREKEETATKERRFAPIARQSGCRRGAAARMEDASKTTKQVDE